MREVHDPHHAEDDAKPDAHQPIGTANQQACRQSLKAID
jgi:hypothetical protein